MINNYNRVTQTDNTCTFVSFDSGFQQDKEKTYHSLVNCVTIRRNNLPVFIRNQQSRSRNGAGLVSQGATTWWEISKEKGDM